MSGLFNTFSVVKRGMQAQQTALHVTSHNVSNANTEGYSVQRAQLKTTQPFGMPSITSAAEPGQLGTGVEVAAITRARDEFIDYQIRRENSTLGKFTSREEFLSEIETIFMEPSDTGLSTNMSKFWDSWQQLSTTPESSTARTIVVQNAETLVNAIKHNYDQLEKMQTNAGDIIKEQVFDVNSTLKQIKELNTQIKAVVVAGKIPNDLMDRRDLLLDQLSERISFDTENTEFSGIKISAKLSDGSTKELLTDGAISTGVSYIKEIYNDGTGWKAKLYVGGAINDETTVSIPDDQISKYAESDENGNVKVDGNNRVTAFKVHTVFYDGKASSLEGLSNGPAPFENGSLHGYETVSQEINKFKGQLNNLARVLAISVNTVHSDNDPSGAKDFFEASAETAGEPAKILAVKKEIAEDSSKINAGKNLVSGNAGNGERALLIGQIRNTRLDILNIKDRADFINNASVDLVNLKVTSSPSGATMDSYFKDSIANLGVSNQEAKRMVTNQEALLTQLETRRDSLSGVSLDEEMANMLQFQRAYEANAKMINVIDQLLDVVVNGLLRR